ncbi:MAG: hypothetical protein COS14_03905 [Bacteroidetes bacterium CG02_land_8_20_14_3_00_31_25]|nr:MAG: hypothetical protein COS14_03905 [Bacteroidetes bacterium CG02_land_8_20_14_3_00_31_25]
MCLYFLIYCLKKFIVLCSKMFIVYCSLFKKFTVHCSKKFLVYCSLFTVQKSSKSSKKFTPLDICFYFHSVVQWDYPTG